tara:strand:- start:714 stop:1442 length:729 start_codon:yes stop_codon:yes gene_type:complete
MKNLAIITVITGNWTKVLPSTKGIDSYVLTTNRSEEFKNHVEEQGWIIRYLSHLEHTEDLLEASLQAKHAKFLMFDKEYEESEKLINKYDYIFYHDHKYYFYDKSILKNFIEKIKNYTTLVGGEKFNVFEEYFRCLPYERYKTKENQIRENINWYIEKRGWEHCTQKDSANMSFLLWNTRHPKFHSTLEELEEEFLKWNHPECQILFNLFLYDRRDRILVEEHWGGSLERKVPEPTMQFKHY